LTWNTAIPGWVAFGHWLLALKTTYAYVPAGCITIDAGDPFNRHVSFPVSLVEFAIAEVWPLFRLKLYVWMTDDPWLPTRTRPLLDEL
jgi:hypothetical protein